MRSESPQHLGHGSRWDTAGVLLSAPAPGEALDFVAIFGNARPVELEIGSGKGTFLLARAAARPEVNFLGIEWAKAYAVYCADRFRRHGLPNVRMMHADATHLVRASIPPVSLSRIHIYFPDPWPKRRHHHRRSIQKPFLADLRNVLMLGGQLLIVTDHFEYACHIQRVLHEADGFLRVSFPEMADKDHELVGTNFERKYIAQGRPFYNFALLRYA